MNTLEAITARRSVKHYDPDFVIPETDINILLDHMIKSPTSYNIQHWRFVLVDDPALKTELCEAAWGQTQVKEASIVFVLCADTKAWEKDPERYWQNAPTDTKDMLVSMLTDFYKGKELLQRDEALRSVGIAAQTTMLTAKALGYDSCPMIGFDADAIAKLINLPEDHIVGMLLPVGKALESARPRGGQLPLSEVVVRNRFA